MEIINRLLSEELVWALGWAVLHSLWQAALVAVVLALILLGLQGKTARLRYGLANGALLFTFLMAAGTFWMQYNEATSVTTILALDGVGPHLIQSDGDGVLIAPPLTGLWQRFGAYFEEHLPLIVALWLAGIVFFLLRLLGGLAYVQQLKRNQVSPLSEEWHDILARLTKRLWLGRAVGLLESARVSTPMVIGHFKPVILLPIGVVNQLTPEQVEAVLAHELAHIFRNDYLWNIIQSVVEVVLYFNPAVWWMAAIIRNERENCCDDVAVALSGNSLAYAKALVGLQEMQRAAPSFAMAFSGKKHRLLHRVKRILNQPQNKSNTMEKFTVTCLLFLMVGVLSMGAGRTDIAEEENDAPALIVNVIDTLPNGKIRLNVEHEGKNIEAKLNDGRISYLKIDDKEIPASEYAEYESMMEDIMADIPPTPPVPPMPPVPAVPGVPATPPVPAVAPAPPMPGFHYRNFRNITTTQGENGKTLITIESDDDDEPLTLEVDGKSGKVLMNGEPLDEGKTSLITDDGKTFFFGNGEGFNFDGLHFELPNGYGAFSWSDDQKANWEQMREDLLQQQQELRRNQDEIRRESEEAIREALETKREQLRQNQEEYRQLQEEARRAMVDAKREQERAMRDFQQAQRDQGHIFGYFDHGGIVNTQLQDVFESELQRDNLIKDSDSYKLEITGDYLKVNGKKQSSDLHTKYKKLYQDFSGFKLTDKSKIVIDKKD